MAKKYLIKYGLIGLGAIIILVLLFRSCGLYDQNSILKGKYDELKRIADADHGMLIKEIGRLADDIALKDKEIIKLNESISLIYTDLNNKDSKITDLVKQLKEAELAGDLPAQIVNLKEQVKTWADKFTLAESIIKEKDAIISNWAIKYEDAVKIGDKWKEDYEREHELRLLGEKRISKLESSLRWNKFWKTGTALLAVAAGGYVAYDLIRGK